MRVLLKVIMVMTDATAADVVVCEFLNNEGRKGDGERGREGAIESKRWQVNEILRNGTHTQSDPLVISERKWKRWAKDGRQGKEGERGSKKMKPVGKVRRQRK